MSKNTNLSFLTDYITADITNGRIGINNASPAYAFDVTGIARTSTSTYLATASGNVGIGTTSPFSQGTGATSLEINGTNYGQLFVTANSAAARGTIMARSSDVYIAAITNSPLLFGTNDTLRLTIASTGAATFSSSVYASRALFDSDFLSNETSKVGIGFAGGYAQFNSWGANTSTYGGFKFQISVSNGGTFDALKIASSGASTFASSVTIGSALNHSLSVGLNQPTTDTLNQIFAGQAAFGGQAAGGETDIGNNWYYYSGWKYRITAPSSNIKLNGDVISFERAASGTANAAISFSESMRITSNGALLINSTAVQGAEALEVLGKISGGGQYGILCLGNPATYTNYALRFVYYANSIVGSITFSTTTTSYNTSSDYRLKEDLKEIKGIEKVSAIKVYDFKWKNEESRMDGVLAHELSKVLPYAVIGEKDGKDMQAVDYSKIVPVLVKAIQELSAEITILKNK